MILLLCCQLVAISFTMFEIGIEPLEVEKRVLQMSRDSELSEDQERELIRMLKQQT